jgi:hypothetical protein
MKKHITAIAVGAALVLSNQANAQTSWFQFEAGIGASRYNDEDGLWVNKGLPHNSHLSAPAYRVGIQFNAIDHQPGSYVPGLAMHLAYLNFGRASVRSLAAPDQDPNVYNTQNGGYYDPKAHSCAGQCGPLRNFVSGGTMQAVALTFEPFWTYRNWRFGVEAGPAIFRGTWDATATSLTDTPYWGPAGSVETFHHVPKWEAGAVVGAAVSYRFVTLRYNYIFAKTHTYGADNPPPGWSGAHMLTLGLTF